VYPNSHPGSQITAWLKTAALATLLVVAALAAFAPDRASAQSPTYFGYNDASVRTWFEDMWRPRPNGLPNRGLTIFEDIAWTLRGGANTVRIPVDWAQTESTKDVYQWGPTGFAYDGMVVFGVRPILTIVHAPDWARHDGCIAGAPKWQSCTGPPDDTAAMRAEMRQFARKLAERMPQAAAIEFWNEPNLGKYFWGGQAPDPARYTRLLCSAYQGIKEAQPTMPVLTGGIAGVKREDPANKAMSLKNFLNSIYHWGGQDCFDAVGYHSYTGPEEMGREVEGHAFRLNEVRTVLAYRGQTHKHIWMTEIGYQSMDQSYPYANIYDYQGQADVMVRSIRYFESQPKVDAFIVHDLIRDNGYEYAFANSVLRRKSLLEWIVEPKPAFCALARERIGACDVVSGVVSKLLPRPQCSDGRDNDGDGVTDHPDDPGCVARTDGTE
jgi:hypothetical protein